MPQTPSCESAAILNAILLFRSARGIRCILAFRNRSSPLLVETQILPSRSSNIAKIVSLVSPSAWVNCAAASCGDVFFFDNHPVSGKRVSPSPCEADQMLPSLAANMYGDIIPDPLPGLRPAKRAILLCTCTGARNGTWPGITHRSQGETKTDPSGSSAMCTVQGAL